MKPKKILLTAVLSTGILLGGTLAYTGQFIFETQAANKGAPVAAVNSQDSDSDDSESSRRHDEMYEDVIVAEGSDPFQLVADQLGMLLDELMSKLDEGESIATLAQENNIDPQTIIAAIADEENKWLDQMIADGEMDAETADEIRKGLTTGATEIVNGNHMLFFGDCEFAMFDGEMFEDEMFEDEMVDYERLVAETLGISVEELIAALESGKTVTDIATEKGLDPQTVVDAVVAADVEWIDEAVAAEEMTAEEAVVLKQELAELTTEAMDEPWEHEEIEIVAMHDMMMDPMGGLSHLDVAAQTLGIAEDELFEMLSEDKTIAEVAEEKGITSESVIDAMTAAARAEITDFVQNGWPAGMPCGDVSFEHGS